MAIITVLNRLQPLEGRDGVSVLKAAQDGNAPWKSFCGGHALCGTCAMVVLDGKVSEPTEIERMLQIAGGSRHFAYGLPGAGDLYVTCQGGRTLRLGRLLGMGRSFSEAREIMAGETLESAEIVRELGKALPGLVERGRLGPDELPVLRALVDVLVHGRPINLPLERFFGGLGRI